MAGLLTDLAGGAANAYVPTADEEKQVREQEEEQLRRVYTASRDRLKDVLESQEERQSDAASK